MELAIQIRPLLRVAFTLPALQVQSIDTEAEAGTIAR